MKQQPLLTIGMIFKNEIRCLERCLKSMEPLRAAIPCELVMADTGSTDGSREVAEKYADILFDFPWINDFAAARNAVIDRSSGAWHLTVDADEWLDGDVSELVDFIHGWSGQKNVNGAVVVRNYTTTDFDGPYTDFFGSRLVCMADRPRFTGTIHEHWQWPGGEGRNVILRKTVLYHDGYVEINSDGETGRKKRERNMALLREKVKQEPENLMVHLQMVESGQDEPDYLDILRQAVHLVAERKLYWELIGPPILRYAVALAHLRKLPEEAEWIQKAEEWFPDSAFIRIDVAYIACSYFQALDAYEEAVRWGERYLDAMEEDRAGRLDPAARLRSALQTDSPIQEQALKISLADTYCDLKREEDACNLLLHLDFSCLDKSRTEKLAQVLMNLQLNSRLDTTELITAVWEGICAPVPSRAKAEERKDAFYNAALPAFSSQNQAAESGNSVFFRHTYALFLPLREQCELGRGAAILETEDADVMRRILAGVEDWRRLPGTALDRALEHGVDFPLPENPLNLEEMDVLAARLAQEPEQLQKTVRRAAGRTESLQALAWARGLVLAAVRVCKWEDGKADMELARMFAEAERTFLPRCYAPEALREENLFLLPPLHRFGWHCIRAFDALDGGDTLGYARHLRSGLAACEGVKPMVEFLTKHTAALRRDEPSPELMALAEKVRAMLAAYPADDPAVAALKASPVYRKVAYLIEGDGR